MNDNATSTAARFDQLPDPIFIGGYMRSGTSFVMKLLQGHPRTTGFKADSDLLAPILNAWMPDDRTIHPYTGINAVMKRDDDRIRKLVRANWFFVYDFAGVPVFEKRVVEKTPDSQALFMRTAEVFPQASFVVVIREPLRAVRSALAHSLLFYPDESTSIEQTLHRVLHDWKQSMEQTRQVVQQLGAHVRLVNFGEFLTDVQPSAKALFAWCGLEDSDEAVDRAVKFAGSPGDERDFWQRILDWPEDEFARRYGIQLDDGQKSLVASQGDALFAEIDAMRHQASTSANLPGLSASAQTRTTAAPGS